MLHAQTRNSLEAFRLRICFLLKGCEFDLGLWVTLIFFSNTCTSGGRVERHGQLREKVKCVTLGPVLNFVKRPKTSLGNFRIQLRCFAHAHIPFNSLCLLLLLLLLVLTQDLFIQATLRHFLHLITYIHTCKGFSHILIYTPTRRPTHPASTNRPSHQKGGKTKHSTHNNVLSLPFIFYSQQYSRYKRIIQNQIQVLHPLQAGVLLPFLRPFLPPSCIRLR